MKMRRWSACALCLLTTVGAARAASTADEEAVRKTVLAANAAYARNDLKAYFSYYAPELTQWLPTGRMSLPEYQQSWTKYIGDGNKVQLADVLDLRIHVAPSGDAAVASYLLTVLTQGKDGRTTTDRNHETDVLFKGKDGWKIVHLHYSPAAAPSR